MDNKDREKKVQQRLGLLSLVALALIVMICGTIGEILFDLMGGIGYIIALISIPFVYKAVTNLLCQMFLGTVIYDRKPTLPSFSLPKGWHLYIVPLFSVIVACVRFGEYVVYWLLRIMVGGQSMYYVSKLYQPHNTNHKILALCFLVFTILFFPIFGFTTSRSNWAIIDFLFAALSIYTNIKCYKQDAKYW